VRGVLTIEFEDGSSKEIILSHAVEIDVSANQRQSLEFRQTKGDKWIMAFTKPAFEGKKFANISVRKEN